MAEQFDISFVQPLDNNDNTGDKNELASLIGGFNPTWDAEDNNDTAFFQAVSVAGLVLDHKFERYLGNERADKRIDQMLEKHDMELGYCVCDISIKSRGILCSAAEKRVFHEL